VPGSQYYTDFLANNAFAVFAYATTDGTSLRINTSMAGNNFGIIQTSLQAALNDAGPGDTVYAMTGPDPVTATVK